MSTRSSLTLLYSYEKLGTGRAENMEYGWVILDKEGVQEDSRICEWDPRKQYYLQMEDPKSKSQVSLT